ncbi:MAG: hypothetical protein MR779_02935 [Tenericutes bacterium]|nr:hypothetical protein [Mycoplasmatota bacterium]
MKVSNIGLIGTKIKKLDEQFPVQDMLLQSGQIEQFGSGIYAYGHIPFLVKKNINDIIVKTLTKYDRSLINLPLLQPESIWISSGRLERYVSEDVMFRCITDKGKFCLAPTAEEAVVEFAKPRLNSYKNLPTTYFQIGEKYSKSMNATYIASDGKPKYYSMGCYGIGVSRTLAMVYENSLVKNEKMNFLV